MKIMAVDFGDSRTGLAVCDKTEFLASPLCVVEEKDFDTCVLKVSEIAKENEVEKIIVGYPMNMNGTIGERADKCKIFADNLAGEIDVPVEMWDERCTTISAHNYLNQTNTRGKKRKAIIDAVAATIILEGYLEYRKNIR
ncbi:MAG: Holliday junction resolvase RuvX [Clostridiales bacterium]|mgnify:CR=1 FL=1|nr:Holliday junction resolvase RuvX [Clostridiales bacterium]